MPSRKSATAHIIAIGSEMLTPEKVDTNSLFLTEELNKLGIVLGGKQVVGDSLVLIAEAVMHALLRCDILLISGGLGPTEDDLTREAVAQALGRGLVFDEQILDGIRERFKKFGRPMTDRNRKQAFLLEGGQVLPNPNGTAPGQMAEIDGKLVFLLPGPPRELKPMVLNHCVPVWRDRFPQRVLRTFTFRIAGLGESEVDERVAPIYTKFINPETTILASAGDITLQFRAVADSEEEAQRLLAAVAEPVRAELGERIYSENGDSLELAVRSLLEARSATLAVAESCTGGSLAARLTEDQGAERTFVGGFLVYQEATKIALAGLDPAILEAHTAVSEETATALAANTRERSSATYALSVTGYAGPGGGTEAEPVGTVYVGLATPDGTRATRFRFTGDRERVRRLATQYALDLLRLELMRTQ